jgi:hypothetical protein
MGTKYSSRFGPLLSSLALEAVQCVAVTRPDGSKEIDLKKYALATPIVIAVDLLEPWDSVPTERPGPR